MSVLTSEGRDAVDRRLDDLTGLFEQAEQEIKRLERLDDQLPIPSINELRYAGHHISRGWQARERDDGVCSDEIEKAIKHCKRAIYDAHEIGIQHHLQRIKLFQDDYRKVAVGGVVTDYHDMLFEVNQAASFIGEIGQERWNDRDGYYSECQRHFEVVGQIAGKLDVARDDLNASIKRDRKKAIGGIVGTGLVIMATIITAIIAS